MENKGFAVSATSVHQRLHVEIVIFDMDGVLIDVSKSYRESIKRTVALYLKRALGLKGYETSLVSDADIVTFKEIGGLNNDWDVTTGLLYYFISLLEGEEPQDAHTMGSMDEVISFLRKNRGRIRGGVRDIIEKKDIPRFQQHTKRLGTGLEAIKRALNSRKTRFIFGTGDLKVDNLVKRIFQEIYLGPHFKTIYHVPPRFYSGRGFFERERLMVKRGSLSILSKRVKMGIASGRPKAEAILGLKKFGIKQYFRSLVTLEDCEAEQERIFTLKGKRMNLFKPNPFSIIKAVGQISQGRVRCAYVGDIPDDIEAANRAKREIDIIAMGCLGSHMDKDRARKRFLEMGADLIIEGVDDLVSFIQ
ncbi:MAG: HAD family hydrolase [Syntrophobacterales bacterium]|nr:MAG: HAD family hydrolase [Syntrophobacterales bacterium]